MIACIGFSWPPPGSPGAFPFREIDGALYVDGGVTGNILYGGATRDERTLTAVWAVTYPDLPVPTVRFWGDLQQSTAPAAPGDVAHVARYSLA